MYFRLFVSFLFPFTLLILPFQTHALTIDLNDSERYQVMDGFGASQPNWLKSPYDSLRFQKFLAEDLGVTVIRVELHPDIITSSNSCDGNPTFFEEDITANASKMFPEHSRTKLGWSFAKAIYNLNPKEIKVMTSIWTPPHWMKEGAVMGTHFNSYGGRLPDSDSSRTQYARYIVAAVKALEEFYGFPLYALSLQNELAWSHAEATSTTSCQYLSTQDNGNPGYNTYVAMLKRLKQEMVSTGKDEFLLMGPEHGTIGMNDYWTTWQQMKHVKDIYSDPEALSILGIWAHHQYGLNPTPNADGRKYNRAVWDGLNDPVQPALRWKGYKEFNKPVWMTEVGKADHSWGGAMTLANMIQDGIVAGNLSAYLEWVFCSGDANDIHSIAKNSGDFHTHKTYAFKHFSKFIRPGAVRIGAGPDDPNGVTVSAFLHEQNRTVTVVLINNGSSAQNVTVSVPAWLNIPAFSGFQSTSEKQWDQFTSLQTGGVVTVDLPPSSITTLYSTFPTSALPGCFGELSDNRYQKLTVQSTRSGILLTSREQFSSAGIELYNQKGRLVGNLNIGLNRGIRLAGGLYLLRITDGGKAFCQLVRVN